MSTIVLVHGRSQQRKDPIGIEQTWEDALLAGLSAAGVRPLPGRDKLIFAYYGDLYDDYALVARQPLTAASKRQRLDFERRIAGRIGSSMRARKRPLRAAAKRERGAAGIFDPVIQIFDRVPGFAEGALRLIFRDVYDYQRNVDGIRDRTMARVRAPIEASAGGKVIVVAHSLGTIVTYDILNTHPNLRVDHYVTIGSPLAIDQAVKRRLLPDARGRRDVPACVRAWTNFADEDDVVALDKQLANDFKRDGKPFIADVDVDNGKGSPHSSSSYLRQRRLGLAVRTAL